MTAERAPQETREAATAASTGTQAQTNKQRASQQTIQPTEQTH